VVEMHKESFLDDAEVAVATEFQEKGYVIVPVNDEISFDRIRSLIIERAATFLNKNVTDHENFLNNLHDELSLDKLNALRLEVIRSINSESWLRPSYFRLARPVLEALVGNELAMQMRINLSIQLPKDGGSLLPLHADVWSGDSPYEVVVWLPLVDCYETKSMFLLPPDVEHDMRKRFSDYAKKSSEELYQSIKNHLIWIEIKAGEVLIFNQNLPHGNRINDEAETRWSLNCRFKGVFTPYGDKKLGEFFEPITLKPASRVGMSYRLPTLSEDSDE
jgi:sporadic carbohydrate cluster 2OG-Fe(II) oxygenase